jgi:chaperonin GroES
MKTTPLFDKVIVKRAKEEDRSKGGIVIPDSAKEKPSKGKVLAIGDGRLLDDGSRTAMVVKEGDVVLFSRYAGNEIAIDGEDVVIMSQQDILAVLS